jgi:predicted DNA-binding transcriptional regulator YafY
MNRTKDEWIKGRRLLRLSELLRTGEFTVKQLVQRFDSEATERDLQRDLQDLRKCVKGFGNTQTRPPRYYIRAQQTALHPIETLALHSATRLVYHRASGHNLHYSNALKLISKWLPPRIAPVIARGTKDIGKRQSKESSALEHVATAWFEGQRLKFEYQAVNGSGTWRSNELEVYFIEVHPTNLGLYAVGMETSFHGACRTFKLSRMRNIAKLPGTRYTIPDDFNPQEFFRHAWGVTGQSDGKTITVQLRFAPEAARRLEERDFPNMTIRAELDGSRLVTIRCGVDKSGLPLEVLAWVLTWGPRVEVLKPEALRTRWLEDCAEVIHRYGK